MYYACNTDVKQKRLGVHFLSHAPHNGLMEIGQKIKAVRDALGFSQERLAAASRVTRNTISRWENDPTHKPTYESLASVARAMGVTPGFIADYGDPSAEWKHPVTGAAKTDMVKKLLRELAEHYPYGPSAKALQFLEEGTEDPPMLQEILAKVRKILISGNKTATTALLFNLDAFIALVDAEGRTPPP